MAGRLDSVFQRALGPDYYHYDEIEVVVRDRRYRVASKMGLASWPGLDLAALLLAESLEVGRAARIVNLGCGDGLVAVVAAGLAPDGQVFAVDTNYLATEAARHTAEWNDAPVHVLLGESTLACREGAADAVLINLPKGKEPVHRSLRQAHRLLAVGGQAYLAGANEAGIKGYSRLMARMFGNLQVLSYRKGHRVVRATKAAAQLPADLELGDGALPQGEPWLHVPARGKTYTVDTEPGVFSWQELDTGTAALLEAMRIRPGDTVLDLGCGYGILGLVAADLAAPGTVYLVDSDIRAIAAVRRTLARNHVSNAVALVSDVISAVQDLQFDVVVTNPPFHVGVATEFVVPLAFIAGSARVLRPGGRLYIVANRFIKYEPYIERLFTSGRAVHEDRQFKVLAAIR